VQSQEETLAKNVYGISSDRGGRGTYMDEYGLYPKEVTEVNENDGKVELCVHKFKENRRDG